ncbi:MAG TPA: hypothetical protein VFB43_18305 [Terracidiphilus sp.]|nr:hypothetical protein [Terracidiphilus sp.]
MAGEQAAAEKSGCPASERRNRMRAIAAGFEPASSAPEVSVAFATGQGGLANTVHQEVRWGFGVT